jgi:hypothetical protein
MYMSYYKRPELMMFDEYACENFPKMNQRFWFAAHPGLWGLWQNGIFYETDDRTLQTSIIRVTSQLNTDICLGRYAAKNVPVYYISKAFRDAMSKVMDKLYPLIREKGMLRSVHEECCIIDGKITFVFLNLKDDNFRMLRIADGICTEIIDYTLDDVAKNLSGFSNVEALGRKSLLDSERPMMALVNMMGYIYYYLVFKKYGNINIETVAARKTLKRSQILGEKVNNFMGIDVQVLDSRWFTTICRDEGFLVSGHFRLQNVKENGEWTKRLIYINPYAKHGYHRLAPIVNIEKE